MKQQNLFVANMSNSNWLSLTMQSRLMKMATNSPSLQVSQQPSTIPKQIPEFIPIRRKIRITDPNTGYEVFTNNSRHAPPVRYYILYYYIYNCSIYCTYLYNV